MVEGLGSSTIIEPHPESCHDSALFLFDALLQHSFTEQIYHVHTYTDSALTRPFYRRPENLGGGAAATGNGWRAGISVS